MSLSATEIAMVVAHCQAALTGGSVRKVISPARPDRLVLEIRVDGKSQLLQLVLSNWGARIGRVAARPRVAGRPHPFAMLLRREAQGLCIADMCQIGNDRAVALHLEGRNRQGTIVCELTARHSNMFWLAADGRIAGSFYVNRSHKRALVPGEPYTPPIPRSGLRLPEARFADGGDLEARIETYYAQIGEQRELETARAQVRRAARTAATRLDRLLVNLDRDRARADEAELLRTQAFVLQANLRLVRKGMRELATTDFEGQPVLVPLDPALDASANMQRLFGRAKRLGRAAPMIDTRIEEARSRRNLVTEVQEQLDAADRDQLTQLLDQLRKFAPDLVQRIASGRRGRTERLPYHEIPIAAGRPARVGRSAADNDTLTLKFARSDDLWLHVRGRKGSHVVVPMGRGEEPSSDLLVDAAHLAAHYSDARGEVDVEITWTRRRYVQKPRGASPGSVRLLREKTILLKVDREHLARLLDAGVRTQ